jgi:hypothetical protein
VTRDVGSGVFFQVYKGLYAYFTDSGLEAGNYYTYKVKAYNAIGYGPESATLTAIAGGLPDQVTTQIIVLESSTELTIGWDEFSLEESGGLPVLNYLVKSDNSDFNYGEAVENGQNTEYSKTILSGNEGKIYRFRVAV